MPNPPHEMLHNIFREDADLFSRVLSVMEIPFPKVTTASIGNVDVTETRTVLGRFVDTVLEAQTEDGPFLIAIEAQNELEAKKLRNWAYYPAYLHERRRCPVVVIVICRDAKTAEWARKPYRIGLAHQPTLVSTPIVVGPDNLPRITDSAQVLADPYAAVLCALTYAHDPEVGGILESIATALPELGDDRTSKFLMDYIDRGLQGTAAQEIWRKTLSIIPITGTYRSEMAMESRAEGQAEGTTNSVLQILDSRGIAVSPAAHAHITACTDLELATTWVREALTVASTDELTGLAEG
jgi:hypothetical protein